MYKRKGGFGLRETRLSKSRRPPAEEKRKAYIAHILRDVTAHPSARHREVKFLCRSVLSCPSFHLSRDT